MIGLNFSKYQDFCPALIDLLIFRQGVQMGTEMATTMQPSLLSTKNGVAASRVPIVFSTRDDKRGRDLLFEPSCK
jgi:hypothetical protein